MWRLATEGKRLCAFRLCCLFQVYLQLHYSQGNSACVHFELGKTELGLMTCFLQPKGHTMVAIKLIFQKVFGCFSGSAQLLWSFPDYSLCISLFFFFFPLIGSVSRIFSFFFFFGFVFHAVTWELQDIYIGKEGVFPCDSHGYGNTEKIWAVVSQC